MTTSGLDMSECKLVFSADNAIDLHRDQTHQDNVRPALFQSIRPELQALRPPPSAKVPAALSLAPNTGEHSAQQGEAAAQPPEDVHGHRRPPLALDQLEEADIVADEAVVAGEVAPAAAAQATAVVSARVGDVPRPPPAGSLKNDLFADCSQVLACKF